MPQISRIKMIFFELKKDLKNNLCESVQSVAIKSAAIK
jgi:hypothetical protein